MIKRYCTVTQAQVLMNSSIANHNTSIEKRAKYATNPIRLYANLHAQIIHSPIAFNSDVRT